MTYSIFSPQLQKANQEYFVDGPSEDETLAIQPRPIIELTRPYSFTNRILASGEVLNPIITQATYNSNLSYSAPELSSEAIRIFEDASATTGGFVHLLHEHGNIAAVIGADDEPVLVYKIAEELDAIVDYDDLRERFPTLSYTQISSVLAYFRKLAQFNTRGLDIDQMEDHLLEADPQFQAWLASTIENGGETRVLTP